MTPAQLAEALQRSLLERPGVTTREQREAAMRGEGDYAKQIQHAAYKVTAEQVEALRTTHSDDALFELTVCAAHGAARQRVEAGLNALNEAYGDEP
ncbi:MAG: hypothetical protein GQE15_07520 [Archangiaceae bacterium]|nr:hypothetical protein [Archangiaceae bacterium]